MKSQVSKSEENKKKPLVNAKEDRGDFSLPLYILNFLILFLILMPAAPQAAEKAEALTTDYNFLSKDTERYILENGLCVILKRDSRTPTFALNLLVNTGSSTEGPYSGSGITHLVEHMMFKGTKNFTATELENKLKSLGAQTNAFTSLDYTCFKLQAPAVSLNDILRIVTDMIKNPEFANEEFQREKQVILREIDMGNDDPEKYLSKLLWQTAYIQHPYKHPVIGYKDIFEQIELKDLISYYNQQYVPNNMVLSIVGDIEPQVVLLQVKQALGALERKVFTSPAVISEPQQISSRYFAETFSISRPLVLMGFHTVQINDKDLYALDTLSIILGAGLTSRLYKTLHDDKKLVNSVNSYNYTPRYPGLFIISAVTQADKVDEVITAIKEEIDKVKQSLPKENELSKAKAKVLSAYLLELQTQQGKADALAADFALTGDLSFQDKYVKGIESLTAEDIQKVAVKYLTDENTTVVKLLPADSAKAESTAPSPKEIVQGLKTVKNTLPNGLMALVTENHATPVCSVTISIKGGLRAEAQKNNGISNLTALAMLKGAAGYKKDEIAELIDSLGAQLSPYAGNNSFGFSANFRSKDLEKLLDVLSSIIIAPTFPQDEIDILKNDILAQIQLDYDDIFKHTGISLRKNLFKSHPYGLIAIGTKESVANITRDDLIAFHKNFCVSKNVVVSICGDINNEKAHEIIKDKFGKMPQGEIFNVEQLNLDTANPPTQTIEPMEKKQAVVMIGFKGASLYNNDRYPLQVLSSLFSDGGGRLYSQIRQKEGLAYTLGTFGMVGLDTGAFIFYAATAPGYANQVGESIINQIQQISNGNITDEEINAAKKSLITKYQLGLQSNEAFAMQTGLDELYGFGYDYHTRYSELVTSVSKKDLIVVAKKYFKLDKSATVTTLPAQYIKR